MSRLTFLGTGGGRFAAVLQARATGGIYLQLDLPSGGVLRLHLDPGPGALIRMLEKRLDPLKTDAMLVSHCHPDHYGDAEILIEGMTQGCSSRTGALVGSRSVIEGIEAHGPAISKYHLGKPALVRALSPGESVELSGVEVRATFSAHSDPSSVGFSIRTPHGTVGYVSDTAYDERVASAHAGSRLLVLPVTRPLGARIPYHLDVEDAVKLVSAVRPEMAFLNHFGMKVIKEGPEKAAEQVQSRTGVRTLAPADGTDIDFDGPIRVSAPARWGPPGARPASSG